MRKAASAALVALLGACAYDPLVWTHRISGAAEYDRDAAQCRYEANLATASYSTGPTARTRGGAIAQGIGEGLTRGMRQGDLMTLCMQARGWYQVRQSAFVYPHTPPVPIPPESVPRVRSEYEAPLPRSTDSAPPATPDAPVPQPARDPASGRWAYAAERVSAFYFPCEAPRAHLTSSNVRTEFFEVVCASGMSVPIQCDYAECTAAR